MKTTRWLAVAVLALAAPGARATNGMRMMGFGPVQDAMGGVSVAAPLDGAVLVTNPAGLTALERRADLAGAFFDPTVHYSAQGAASGASMTSDRSPSYIPTVALVLPSTDRVTVGIAALGIAGMGVDYRADLYGGRTTTAYMNARVAPAVAYRVTDRLSIGVAANLMYATMRYAVAAGMGMVPRDTTGAFGIGATLGVQYRPIDALTLGIAYETKSSFQTFDFRIPPHTLVTPQGSFPVPGGTERLDFDQPQVATVGAGVRPIEALLVAADVEWIDWSQTNGRNQPAFTTDPLLTGAQPWNLNWSDQVVLKIGAEYAATRELRIRAGYDWGKSPLDASRAFENIAFPAIAEHHFTVGIGYAFGGLAVNAAAVISPETTLRGSNLDEGIASYETRMSQLAFDLGVAYRF